MDTLMYKMKPVRVPLAIRISKSTTHWREVDGRESIVRVDDALMDYPDPSHQSAEVRKVAVWKDSKEYARTLTVDIVEKLPALYHSRSSLEDFAGSVQMKLGEYLAASSTSLPCFSLRLQ